MFERVKRVRRYTGPVILVLGGVFLSRYLLNNISDVQTLLTTMQVQPMFLVLAFAAILLNLPLSAFEWALIYRWQGAKSEVLETFRLVIVYQISSFVPGVVPQFLNVDTYAKKSGMQSQNTFVTLLLNEAGKVIVSLGLLFTYLLFRATVNVSVSLWWIGVGICGTLVVSHPYVMERGINTMLWIIGRNSITVDLDYLHSLLVFLYSLGLRLIGGTAFYFLLIGLGVSVPWFDAVAIHSGAWVIGFLTIIVPGGLGVREGVMTYLLSSYVPTEFGVLIAAFARGWSLFPQIVFALLVVAYQYLEDGFQE